MYKCIGKYTDNDNTFILWDKKNYTAFKKSPISAIRISYQLSGPMDESSQGTDSLVEHVLPSLLGHRRNLPGTLSMMKS